MAYVELYRRALVFGGPDGRSCGHVGLRSCICGCDSAVSLRLGFKKDL